MKQVIDSFISAWGLLFSLDTEIYKIIALSLLVSLSSTGGATVLAVPLGVIIGTKDFIGKKLIVRIINTFMGFPPVIAGLIVYLFLSRKGPLGQLELLFTPIAMVIAQILIVAPIIAGLTISAVNHKYRSIEETCKGLGMTKIKIMSMLIKECKYPILSAILAGYGRASAEVGAVMLVGGNIQYETRVMTTSIMLETGKGNYDKALAIGIILILVTFLVNRILQHFQEEI